MPDDQQGIQPRWTFITVTYNSAESLERYWSSVDLDPQIEWIVVDNASQDDSCAIAERLGAYVIPLAANRGFGGANNIGFLASKGRYVCFVNPDVTPIPAELPLLEAVVDATPKSIVAPQLVNDDGSPQPNGRGVPLLTNKILHRLAPEQVATKYRRFAGPGDITKVAWLTGAVIAGTRDWFHHLGPWDERFFVYYEDADLGIRNAARGGVSAVVGDSRWVHGWKRETAKLSFRAWRCELPSLVKFYTRYPGLLFETNDRRRNHEG